MAHACQMQTKNQFSLERISCLGFGEGSWLSLLLHLQINLSFFAYVGIFIFFHEKWNIWSKLNQFFLEIVDLIWKSITKIFFQIIWKFVNWFESVVWIFPIFNLSNRHEKWLLNWIPVMIRIFEIKFCVKFCKSKYTDSLKKKLLFHNLLITIFSKIKKNLFFVNI